VEPGRIQVRSEPAGARVSIDHAYLGVTPLMSNTLLPGKHKVRVEAEGRFPWLSDVEVMPGQDLGITLGPTNLPERRRWPARVAYGTAGLAGVSLAAGGFLGVLSQLNPTGSTRADVQKDTTRNTSWPWAPTPPSSPGRAGPHLPDHLHRLPRRHLRPARRVAADPDPRVISVYPQRHTSARGRGPIPVSGTCATGRIGYAECRWDGRREAEQCPTDWRSTS
jgi:hypothetical protein